mmetsp:Transcript_22907/g.73644  ORF Transcript_22907/g.73644 Transcript_22907/m.73644 type:complete len:330 (+) Transcript_22907:391-1380(+)
MVPSSPEEVAADDATRRPHDPLHGRRRPRRALRRSRGPSQKKKKKRKKRRRRSATTERVVRGAHLRNHDPGLPDERRGLGAHRGRAPGPGDDAPLAAGRRRRRRRGRSTSSEKEAPPAGRGGVEHVFDPRQGGEEGVFIPRAPRFKETKDRGSKARDRGRRVRRAARRRATRSARAGDRCRGGPAVRQQVRRHLGKGPAKRRASRRHGGRCHRRGSYEAEAQVEGLRVGQSHLRLQRAVYLLRRAGHAGRRAVATPRSHLAGIGKPLRRRLQGSDVAGTERRRLRPRRRRIFPRPPSTSGGKTQSQGEGGGRGKKTPPPRRQKNSGCGS